MALHRTTEIAQTAYCLLPYVSVFVDQETWWQEDAELRGDLSDAEAITNQSIDHDRPGVPWYYRYNYTFAS